MRMFLNGFVVTLALNASLVAASFGGTAASSGSVNQVPTGRSTDQSTHLVIWRSEFNAEQPLHGAELPPLLSPVDSSPQFDRSPADVPQNVPVEAVPAPTAVASGMLVLTGLAAFRIYRKLRFV